MLPACARWAGGMVLCLCCGSMWEDTHGPAPNTPPSPVWMQTWGRSYRCWGLSFLLSVYWKFSWLTDFAVTSHPCFPLLLTSFLFSFFLMKDQLYLSQLSSSSLYLSSLSDFSMCIHPHPPLITLSVYFSPRPSCLFPKYKNWFFFFKSRNPNIKNDCSFSWSVRRWMIWDWQEVKFGEFVVVPLRPTV